MSNINNNLSYVQEKAKNPGTFVEKKIVRADITGLLRI